MEHTVIIARSRIIRSAEGKRFDVLGAHLLWKARGEDTDGTFTVAVQTLSPEEAIPRHRHRYPEMFYVLSGELEFTLFDGANGVTHTVNAGDTILVATSTDHGARNATGMQATLLDIASVNHQHFFDTVQHEAAEWGGITPDEAMHRVGEIGRQHTLDFWKPE